VRRILLTGMSGVGKSSVVRALVALGHRAVDTDDGWCEPTPDGRQRWRAEAIGDLLATEGGELLFVAGCEENQGAFYPQFDRIILLSAPLPVLVRRIRERDDNPYGRSPEQFARFLDDVEQVEPLLRRGADLEIDTDRPLDDVVAEVLRAARAAG
jgi:shikimate kinase